MGVFIVGRKYSRDIITFVVTVGVLVTDQCLIIKYDLIAQTPSIVWLTFILIFGKDSYLKRPGIYLNILWLTHHL